MSTRKWFTVHAHDVRKKDIVKVAGRKREVKRLESATRYGDTLEIQFKDGTLLTVDQYEFIEVKR